MHLYYIEPPGCYNTFDIMDGIKAVYQMEAEFQPYLIVNFLPNDFGIGNVKNKNDSGENERIAKHGGISLVTIKGEQINKMYKFKNKKDIEDLRKLIWYYLERDYNVKHLDTRTKFKWEPTSSVIDSWVNSKKRHESQYNGCVKIIKDTLLEEKRDKSYLHEIFRVNPQDQQTKETCIFNRSQECNNNYSSASPLHEVCMKEVNWLCEKGYGKNGNVKVKASDAYVKYLRNKIHKRLIENKFLVNKRMFDEIVSDGMLDEIVMGKKDMDDLEKFMKRNKYMLFTEPLAEGFGGDGVIDVVWVILFLIIFLMLVKYIVNG